MAIYVYIYIPVYRVGHFKLVKWLDIAIRVQYLAARHVYKSQSGRAPGYLQVLSALQTSINPLHIQNSAKSNR